MSERKPFNLPTCKPGQVIRADHTRRGTITARVLDVQPHRIQVLIVTGSWRYLSQDDDLPGDIVWLSDVNNLCTVTVVH